MASAKRSAERREATEPSVPEARGEALSAKDLRRLQLAHEGMRLLLSSEIKQAELLFRRSRLARTASDRVQMKAVGTAVILCVHIKFGS